MKSMSTALTNIRRTPYQSLSAFLILCITFFVIYAFSLFAYVSQKVILHFETQPRVIAFFELDTSKETISKLAKKMQDMDYVSQVKIIDKEEALKIYKEENKDDPLLLELVSADILPASIEVSGNTLDSLKMIKSELKSADRVDDVMLQEDILESLKTWTNNVRLIGIGIISILTLTSVMMIVVLTGMKVSNKRAAIRIMDILGASSWFISSPFIFEGMFIGVFASTLSWTGVLVSTLYLTPWLKQFVSPVAIFPIPVEFFAVQVGIGSLIAIILGGLASGLAVSRMKK